MVYVDEKLNKVCDYIIASLNEAGEKLNVLKLHKLLYYVQAWHFAFYKAPLFNGKFQAWVNGPVSREIFDRFNDTKTMYSLVLMSDIKFDYNSLDPNDVQHIDNILESYGSLSGSQLVTLTHSEDPWLDARKGVEPNERCSNNINEDLMAEFYSQRLPS